MKNFSLVQFNRQKADFSLKNQLFYAVLLILFTFYGFCYHYYFLLLFAFYYLFYFILRKKLGLLALSCVFLVVLCGRFYLTNLSFQSRQTDSFQARLVIYPDTLTIDGNLVRADGQLQHHLVKVQYQLKSAEEKSRWQQQAPRLTGLVVKAHFTDLSAASNQHAFDYRQYLDEKDYLGVLAIDQYQFFSDHSIDSLLHRLRAKAMQHVNRYFHQQTRKYVLALLFGYRNDDFQEEQQIFSATGILHLFSISGTHVLFFFGLIEYCFRRVHLSYRQRFFPMLLSIILGIFLFGGSISVWRAAILYFIKMCLSVRHFSLSSLDLYSLVCLILLLIFPNSFAVLSGQLSLLVTFYLLFIPKQLTIKQEIMHMQYLTVLTAPFVLAIFYEWPTLGGILTFLFTLIFQWLILPGCLLLFGLSFFPLLFPFFETIFTYILLFFEKGLAYLSWSNICLGQLPLWLASLCMITGLFAYTKKKYLSMLVICLGMPLVFHLFYSLPIKVSFVDVGQGDCAVIQSSFNQEVYVIDTGGRVTFQTAKWQQRKSQANVRYSLLAYLKGEGIRHIDGLILTHGDQDHMGDALTVLQSIKVKHLYVGTQALKSRNLRLLLKQLPKRTRVQTLKQNDWIGKRVQLNVLFPKQAKAAENQDSLILFSRLHQQNYLFMGDLPIEQEQILLKQYPNLKADIVKIGHHGSKTSTSTTFLKQVEPKIAVISVGKNNRYHHPNQEVINRLNQRQILIRRTDQVGMIQYVCLPFSNDWLEKLGAD